MEESKSGAAPSEAELEQREAARALKVEGNAAFQSGDYAESIRLYSKAIEKDPENAIFYGNRAQAYLNEGRLEEAIADSERSVVLNPSFVKGYFRWVQCLKSLGRYSDALSVYFRCMNHCTPDASIYEDIKRLKNSLLEHEPPSETISSKEALYASFARKSTFERMATLVFYWNHSKRTERLQLLKEYLTMTLSEASAQAAFQRYTTDLMNRIPPGAYECIVIPNKVEVFRTLYHSSEPEEKALIDGDLRILFMGGERSTPKLRSTRGK